MAILEDIKSALLDYEPEKVVELTSEALSQDVAPNEIIDIGLIPGIEIIGEKFKDFEIFLPEVMMAAKAFKAAFELISPKLKESGYEPRGRVLVGSVEGDIHDIGKNIVLAMLQGNGYEVHDAGVDVTPARFIELARELKPNVIGMSALLTTTMTKMKDTVEALKASGLRDSVKVIIGGAPASEDYASEIGADGYGEDASEAVGLVKALLGK